MFHIETFLIKHKDVYINKNSVKRNKSRRYKKIDLQVTVFFANSGFLASIWKLNKEFIWGNFALLEH